MSQQFILTEARDDDCSAVAMIEFDACASDPGFSTIFHQGATPTVLEDYTRRFRNDLRDDPTCHLYVVRDSASGEIVSFATWHFFPERTQNEIDEQMLLDDFNLPEDSNREAGNLLIRNGLRKRHDIMGTKAYAYLAATGTALKWRKQGAASLLLQHGLFMADRQGLASYVEGTPVAKALYGKFGFVEVDQLRLELGPWKQGEYWNVCMVRPAKDVSSN
jgi:GNAT superfamily N-acetyltransferase